jgi:hypothetical protein
MIKNITKTKKNNMTIKMTEEEGGDVEYNDKGGDTEGDAEQEKAMMMA